MIEKITIAARGLLMIDNFYDFDGTPKVNKDLTIPYPDLSQFEIYKRAENWK